MRIDVMVDLETLGTAQDATIFQIAAVAFDIKTGEINSQFDRIADISKNESYDMTVSGSTLNWWISSPSRVNTLRQLMTKGEGTSSELVENFRKWLQGLGAIGDVYLWGNGILFDNNILRSQMGEENYPIHFRRDRDVRTIVDVACEKLDCDVEHLRDITYDYSVAAHDAMNDVKNQVKLVTYCYRVLLNNLPAIREVHDDGSEVAQETHRDPILWGESDGKDS